MRWRTSGSSANSTSCWMRRLPPSSAGCDLPAITSWIGRSGCSSSALRRAGSRSISVSRLYDGTRRAKPIVRMSGSSTSSTQPSSASDAPRCSQEMRRRRRTSCTSRSRSTRLVAQRSAGGMLPAACHPWVSSASSSPTWAASRSRISRATHVGAWTPLVIEEIGTSSMSKPGHRPENMPRLTSPWSTLTPLAR